MTKYITRILLSLIFIWAASALEVFGEVIIPEPLKPGSKIALVTPASAINDDVIDTAIVKLQALGYEPVVMPHAYGKEYGSYATTDEQRAIDLMAAFSNPEIDAILCTRGGYGTVRLLPMLNEEVIRANPKWLVGYSDISDLHAFMHKAGVASIHGPMCGHLASEPDSLEATAYLFKALQGEFPMKIIREPHPYNKGGMVRGRLVGGNLLTINGLAETPYDVLNPDGEESLILFIEDVDEAIYAIERILMRLHLSGALSRLSGLIIGQFTDYKPSKDFESMEDMIHYWLEHWGYYDKSYDMPIVYDFPTGHVSDNYPMIVSAEAELYVSPNGTMLRYTGK